MSPLRRSIERVEAFQAFYCVEQPGLNANCGKNGNISFLLRSRPALDPA